MAYPVKLQVLQAEISCNSCATTVHGLKQQRLNQLQWKVTPYTLSTKMS